MLKYQYDSNGMMVTDWPFIGSVMTASRALHDFERENMKGNPSLSECYEKERTK